jgi:DNA-binding CsgD family transcriptional regulator/tetratricopeptide (TPR) repeat protein
VKEQWEAGLQEPLTVREREILRLIARGLSNREIAERLFVSIDTVKWYNKGIYAKLDVSSRTRAVARARELNILQSTLNEPDGDAAVALLAELPTARVPEPERASLPANSRPGLEPDPNFTGRETELLELAVELKEGDAVAMGQPVAVSGIGGMGKTSLANAFVYRYGRYFAGGVFWLSFADPAHIPAEIAGAGSRLSLPGFDGLDLPEKIARTRRAWAGPLPRLLIFDNCEDESLIDRYKPVGGGCRVLITSRNAAWATSRGAHILHLRTFPRHDSITFLQKLARRLTDAETDAIAAELGDFPLALHLAGGFLDRYQRVSADVYFGELRRKNPLEHPSLQGRGTGYSPTHHERHVHRTFLLSLERLDPADAIDTLAHDLLRRAACFAPGEPIPSSLLLTTLPGEDCQEPRLALDSEDALSRLQTLGLLEPLSEDRFRLHRLLVVFIQHLGIEDDVQVAVEKATGEVAARLRATGYPVPSAPMLPHLRHLTNAALARAEDAHSAWLCDELAFVLFAQADHDAARRFIERALTFRERTLGPEHPDTAQSLNRLAMLLRTQGDYTASRPLVERVLAIRERTLGPNHPDTAESLNYLGLMLQAEGEYSAALPVYERASAIREQTLGPDHPDTAQSIHNLGYVLHLLGDTSAARPLMERALATNEEALGPNHPSTAVCLSSLAMLLRSQGDTAAARPLLERALVIGEKAYGPDNPNTSVFLTEFGLLLQAQGDTSAARSLFERALAIREETLGPSHPHTAVSLDNLARVLRDVGNIDAARALLERALTALEKALGPDHPDARSVRANLHAVSTIIAEGE